MAEGRWELAACACMRVLLTAAGMAIGVGGPVAADPPPCDEIASASGYCVVLDSLASHIPSGISPDMVPNLGLIEFKLENVIESVRMQSTNPISVVHCRRHPQAIQFGPVFAQKMYDSQVLLEVWGVIEIDRDDQDQPYHRARLTYALMPLCRLPQEAGVPGGIYTADRRTAPGASAAQVMALFEEAVEFQAYAAICTGIKAWNTEQYEIARQFLCMGGSLLERASAGSPSAAQQQLAAYVQELSRNAVIEARKGTSSGLSVLTEAQAMAPCGVTP